MLRAICIILFIMLFGCGPYPKDSYKTLQQIIDTKVLKIGVIEHKPWTFLRGGTLQGIEIKIITEFAKSLNVEPQWHIYPESIAIHKLKENQVNIVVGGLTKTTPWNKEIALTRPYLETGHKKETAHVFAIRKGENQFMITLEKFLKNHKENIHLYYESTL